MTENQQIATTILEQLGGRRFVTMTGARNLCAIPNGLSMRLPGNLCKQRLNVCTVVLEPSDTYTVTFGRVWRHEYKELSRHGDIYCDQLGELFREQTGLETRMPRIIFR